MSKLQVAECSKVSLKTPISNVTMTLTATWTGTKFTWDPAFDFGKLKKGRGTKKGNITFDPGPDTFLITVKLVEKDKRGLKFQDLADALWVGPAGICPPKLAGNANGEIVAIDRPKDDELIIQNTNVTEDYWTYALNFVDKNNQPFTYDPTIANGGGGTALEAQEADDEDGGHHHRK